MNRILARCLAAAVLVLAVPFAAHAQTWTEGGDAGDLVATAQQTAGTGPLTTINGTLASATDVDMYCIHLNATPSGGSPLVQLLCVAIGGPNAWLFDSNGIGVETDETCAGNYKMLLAPNGSLAPGTYYVAVSYSEVDPQSAGGPIWLPSVLGPRAPDGPGAAGALTGWAGTPNVQPLNPYSVMLTGFGYCSAAVPALHATWGVLKSHYR